MKKFYSTIALVSLIVATASASPKVADKAASMEYPAQTLSISNGSIESNVSLEKDVVKTRAISSVADICKPYKVSDDFWYPFEGEPPTSLSCTIFPLEGNMVALEFLGVPGEALVGTVDVANQTLTIKSDDNQGLYEHPTYGPLGLQLRKLIWSEPDENGHMSGTTTIVPSITVEILPDGSLNFFDYVLMWQWTANATGSYTFGVGNFYLEPFVYFNYDAADWKQVGDAQYTDGFLNPLFKPEYQKGAYDVQCYASNSKDGLFLLMNPFGQAVWSEDYFDRITQGYIVVDISNPDCVTMTPLVPSGAWLDFAGEGQPQNLQQFYLFNMEGLKVYNGISAESQVEEAEEAMDPFKETLADYLSSYDANTRTANIIHGMFGETDAPMAGYTWKGTDQKIGLTATIVLPDMSGVNDIVMDANAPVKYYNLQGMEVANPEAGQIVIMKNGSKTSKFIKK